MTDQINIEVAYALPDEQTIIPLQVDKNISINDAIIQSKILEKYTDIDLKKQKIGIFGKVIKKGTRLYAGDRIEIYRPLIADPKEARRKRAAEGKKLTKGNNNLIKSK